MSIYKSYGPEQVDQLLSNFLISSWSYSKVQTFSRHQCAFAMENIYGLKGKRSSSSIAGNGYHTALDYFFSQYKEGVLVELPQLEKAAYEEIGSVPANQWKLGKTTPTMEEAVNDALKDVTKLLHNFYSEKGLYLDELDEIIGVELYFDEWLTVNGVDIQLPCHGKIDLIIRTKGGKVVVIDHKTKASYTDEKEAALVTGTQAITYTLGAEAKLGIRVDEVWFVENKASTNKNGDSQLQDIRIVMNQDNRKLYELLLYENLREMVLAVNNPDHVYTINPADKYVDMAEVFDFWTRTQICEVDDFNVEEDKKELVSKRLRKIRNSDTSMISPEIIKKFRQKAASFIKYDLSMTNMTAPERIEHTLKTFGKMARVAHTFKGYSSDTFLLEVSAGVKVSEIFKYRLDIANALNVENVRISNQLIVHEDRSYLSIDLAKKADRVLAFNPDDRDGWKIPLGKDNFGNIVYWDMDNPATPHALICGQTGSGKSVELINIIEQVKLAGADHIVILDPKYEFEEYQAYNIDVINEMDQIDAALSKLVEQMDKMVRGKQAKKIIIIFDEFADAVTRLGKNLEENLRILLQKGRSSGFRICAATQRASVKVITGDAKVNFPIQICFRVNKEADSRVVLDEPGAEALAGKGDGLIKSPEYRDTVRFQAYYKPSKVTA
jgi:S-DNA-T family DNA segregation ATPase FtsK/SpoIIIE